MKKFLQGYVKRHPDGFGFFIPDNIDHPDVYMPRKHMFGVMTNDRIEIEVKPEPGGDRFRGKLVRILERGTNKITGQLHQSKPNAGFILDVSHAWGENAHVTIDNEDEFKDGDLVSVEITSYPGSPKGLCGKILKVIGDALNPLNDTLRILHQNDIRDEFPAEVLNEAQTYSEEVEDKDLVGRKDLQEIKFITIDGVTAKDFDDAIFVAQNESGFNLKVAIADVSHYVKPDTHIDREAYSRGNSTYFPNFVSPMLPEVLSNGLCSLRPDTPRLAFVADLQLDFQGELLSTEIYEAVIKSHSRVTYGEAQEVVDGSTPDKHKHVEAEIIRAADLAKILMTKRFKEGSLDLEIPETEVEIDESGEPVDIIRSERLFAHRLIEEMMLMANVAVARYLKNKEVPSLNRIHESPESDNIRFLETFMHNLGFQKSLAGGKLQKKITKALQEFGGTIHQQILSILTLRSMKQARYSPDDVGHFGLGFEDYVHFTSPIRRYPDLIIHRQLKSILYPEKGYRALKVGELDSAGVVLSACEQKSVKAERQLIAIKKARFMERFVGQSFEGLINSVAKFGVFVILRQFDVDGLVKVEELGNDTFQFDEENLQLIGKRTGKVYNLGDSLKVRVAAVDTDDGRVDFVLEDTFVAPTPGNRGMKRNANRNQQKQQEHSSQTKKSPQKRLTLKTNRRGLRKKRVSKSRRKGKAR